MKLIQKIAALVCVFLLCIALLPALETGKKRPSVALVLAGGGARGFVHIPVLELIDELDIPVDIIIGTSAGAIIGGLYCAGYTPQEIRNAVLYLDWVDIFRNDNFSPFERALNEHSIPANPVALKLGSDFSLNLGKGLITGQKAYEQLKALTVKIPSYIDFDSLPVSFRAASTDLLSGDLVILEQGDLAEAMRASMSIPGFFEPFIIDGKYYIDGSARDNFPIRTAKKLGYDIIIAVEISNPLKTDTDAFDTSPLRVIEQMTSMQQAIQGKENYELADLVMFPDIRDFSMMDYLRAEDIYKRGKAEAERYRGHLIELKKKIFAQSDAETKKEPADKTESISETGNFKFISEKPAGKKTGHYKELPYTCPEALILKGCKESDRYYMERVFARMAGKPFTKQSLLRLTEAAMDTGNYTAAIPRIDVRSGKNVLELYLHQKPDENGLLLQSLNFAGTASSASSAVLTLSTAVQFRGLSGTGSALSLKTSYVNNTSLKFLFFQPLGPKAFFQAEASVSHEPEFFVSNFDFHRINGSLLRRAGMEIGVGVLFNPHHTLLNKTSLHWFDTRQAVPEHSPWPFDAYNKENFDFAAELFSQYTFSNLNYRTFPTRGFFSSTAVSAVFPLGSYKTPVFERITSDFTAAIPISSHITVLCSLFAGSNLSEQLKKTPSLIPVYGFHLKDRMFFPHVTAKRKFGVHKAAAAFGFQIRPWEQLTILGGHMFFSVNGAIGDVWADYASFPRNGDFAWRVSGGTGLRIKDMFGIRVCAGAGNSDGKISPFISCDFGNILY
ncbi:patatin-like phospholipase family protein [Treponema sp. OMZ 840]|uniref:patatin-like phospholipase family protein n=1 Tax=Treponema sp. OMZ 840 TaxID=244313 RepID=UPI003D8A06EA